MRLIIENIYHKANNYSETVLLNVCGEVQIKYY
jgi:hypothetical protein